MLQTRSQRNLILGEKCVAEVENIAKAEHKSESFRKIYGGLCHDFPVLIRMNGLAQATAYYVSKAAKTDERGQAYRLFLRHQANVLSVSAAPIGENNYSHMLDLVRGTTTTPVDALTYMQHTRRLLEAAVYFKRFAVSTLKVESSESVRTIEEVGGEA
jgi:CRISPR-associated protein Cmr5